MFTKKALMTKWGLYSAALFLFIFLQQLVLDELCLWGVVPFLMPMVVAGKGHETYQILNTGKIHYDEREVVRGILDGSIKVD